MPKMFSLITTLLGHRYTKAKKSFQFIGIVDVTQVVELFLGMQVLLPLEGRLGGNLSFFDLKLNLGIWLCGGEQCQNLSSRLQK